MNSIEILPQKNTRIRRNFRIVEIWDIGHSTLTIEDFIRKLIKNNIQLLVDIRRFPGSKKFPHFFKDSLKNFLSERRIDYLWLGNELGGFRKGGYEKWTETSEFKKGIEMLEQIAAEKRTAFMCAEGYYMRCHRRFIIKILEEKGWTIHHI
ncbi:MAG: DUF488 domain-containing protein [Acidobacteriota bacterium]